MQDRLVPFNRPAVTGTEQEYLAQVFERGKFAGGGPFSTRCTDWLQRHFAAPGAFVTTSCTDALEMAALLCRIEPGDEVILPSFAFSSTATAFARCGASLVFVDVEPGTMNVDPQAVAAAVTPRTKVVVALHYAGVGCDMQALCELADRHGLTLIEDAAQALYAEYRGRPCGGFGRFGCVSFHESKNIQCGEGGALICNHAEDVQRAEIVLEKGTNRSQFFRGEVDKYTWLDIGSSFVLSELNAAFLLAQLEQGRQITDDRLASWQSYRQRLGDLVERGEIEIPVVPIECRHNGHIFWVKARDLRQRTELTAHLKDRGVHSVFHYQPLHTAPAGRRFGRFSGEDRYTSRESERLLRLPLFYGFNQAERVVETVREFYLGQARG